MSLIINTPFACPAQHWVDGKGGKLEIKPERRLASYEVFDARNNTKRIEVLELVTQMFSYFAYNALRQKMSKTFLGVDEIIFGFLIASHSHAV